MAVSFRICCAKELGCLGVAVIACLNFGCYWPLLFDVESNFYWPLIDVTGLHGGVTISAFVFFGVVEQLKAFEILQGSLHLVLAAILVAVEDVSTARKEIKGL